MTVISFANELNKVNSFSDINRILKKYDTNDDGLISLNELSPLEIKDFDIDENKIIDIPELMQALPKVFSKEQIVFVGRLLNDPQINSHLKTFGASVVLRLIIALIKRKEIGLFPNHNLELIKNKNTLIKTLLTIKDFCESAKKHNNEWEIATLAQLAITLLMNNTKTAASELSDYLTISQLDKIQEIITMINWGPINPLELANVDNSQFINDNKIAQEIHEKLDKFLCASPLKDIMQEEQHSVERLGSILRAINRISPNIANKIVSGLSFQSLYIIAAFGQLDKTGYEMIFNAMMRHSNLIYKIIQTDPERILTRKFFGVMAEYEVLDFFCLKEEASLSFVGSIMTLPQGKVDSPHPYAISSIIKYPKAVLKRELDLGKFYYQEDFNPHEAWKHLKKVAQYKGMGSEDYRSEAYFYLGLLYLYSTKDINRAAKLFGASTKWDSNRTIYQAHPSIYYLSRLKNAKFISESYVLCNKYGDRWFSKIGIGPKKKLLVRKYQLSDGQAISLVFERNGRFVTLFPGTVKVSFNELSVYHNIKTHAGLKFIVTFPSFDRLSYNSQILRSIVEMPSHLFSLLKKVIVNGDKIETEYGESLGGYYTYSKQELKVSPTSKIATFSHELLHHFDFYSLSEEEQRYYYQISWHDWGWSSAKSKDQDQRDFSPIAYCENPLTQYKTLTKWNGEKTIRGNCPEGTMPYGMDHPREDFATFGTDYYNNGAQLRSYVLEQIKNGNFEPAVKYMFFKHIVFKGAEYGLSFSDRGLGVEEVKNALQEHLGKQPDSVRKSTLETFYYVYNNCKNYKEVL